MNTPAVPATSTDSKAGGIYAIELPVDGAVLTEVRKLVSDSKVRREEIGSLVCQDPAICIELIKVSNSMMFSSGRPPVTTIKAALERLGESASNDTLQKLTEVPVVTDAKVRQWTEIARARCRHAGKIAKIFAEVLAPPLQEDCELAGALIPVGEMLAPLNFKEKFTKMADEQKVRTKIIFRLEKDFQFDPIKIGVNYLRRVGLPEMVMFAVDEDSSQKLPARTIMRPICKAGAELAIAFEDGKLEKYAPGGNTIPPKSPIRILKMSEAQYKSIYEKVTAYFGSQASAAKA